MPRVKNAIPLKIWKNWSAGIGYPKDDGRTPGMSYASGLLGIAGELRPAPFMNVVTTSVFDLVAGYNLSASVAWKRAACTIAPSSGSTVAAASTVTDSKTNGTSLTYAHSIDTVGLDDVVVYTTVHNDSNADPTSVTYDGDAMTRVTGVTTATERVSIWRKINPNRGTVNVVVNIAGGTDLISSTIAFSGTHQTTPETASGSTNASSSGPITVVLTAEANGAILIAISFDDTSETATLFREQTSILSDTQGTMEAEASYKASATTDSHFQYFFEAEANTDGEHPFLYAMRGFRFAAGWVLHKIDLSTATFGTFETSSLAETNAPFPGQPAKFKGFWWLPAGNDYTPRKLSVVGTGDASTDTLDTSANPFVPGADHLVAFGNQLAGSVKEGVSGLPGFLGYGTNSGGISVLQVGGAPATATNWGSVFPVGDVTDRAAGLTNIKGATFVLMPDGLYSFNSKGRAGLVHGELGAWENTHINVPMSTYKGGLVISLPSGLIFYVPGEEPISISVGKGMPLGSMPASGVSELHGGIHHSTDTVANFIYEVYQPNSSSTNALLLCGYAVDGEFIWQSLGALTLLETELMMGCKVARNGKPNSADYVTPTLWSQSGADLVYIKLDPSASPFHSRADTHKVVLSGNAFMSELIFPEPVDLSELVVYTQDMLSDDTDEWQMSFIVNATGNEENFAPIVQNGRTAIPLTNKLVHRLTLHVQWVATSTSDRVPPTIAQIELYGKPTESVVS